MELILISDNKLKIMLTEEDMFRYEICAESIDYDNTETRRAFWQILDEAKHRTGFDAASDRVFIQVYPSRGGGCEMYVTKLSHAPRDIAEPRDRVILTDPPPPPKTHRRSVIYSFGNFERLAEVCRLLREKGYGGESAAYADRSGGLYHLVIDEQRRPLSQKGASLNEYSFIEEYGRRRSGTLDGAYIKEHGICIEPRRAVEVLSELG